MKYYVTSITKIVLHFLAKCKGTDTNQLLPSIVKWQALISLAQFGEKKKCDSKKSTDENFNECCHTSYPDSTDLKEIKRWKFQWMSSYFASVLHRSLITTAWAMWWRCTQPFFQICAIQKLQNVENSLEVKPKLHEWHLHCSLLLKLVIISSKYVTTVGDIFFICMTAWHLSHNFHCGWKIDSGGRIKCARSLMCAKTCLVYKCRWVSFLLSRGHAAFIQAHATLTKSEGLLCNFLCFFSVFAWRLKLVSKWELENRSIWWNFTATLRAVLI